MARQLKRFYINTRGFEKDKMHPLQDKLFSLGYKWQSKAYYDEGTDYIGSTSLNGTFVWYSDPQQAEDLRGVKESLLNDILAWEKKDVEI